MNLVELKGVTVGKEPRPRLRDISVTLPASGVTAILGWSGAGKSTLLQVLAGFLKPDAGSCLMNATSAWAPGEPTLWPWLTVAQHIPAAQAGTTSDTDWLSVLDLETLAQRKPEHLSLGEAGRVNLLRALASPAQLLLFDEPLAHVEGERRAQLWRSILAHVRKEQRSVLFATHDPSQVLGFADHVICLEDGCLMWEGPTDALYQNPPDARCGRLLGPLQWWSADEWNQFFPGIKPVRPAVRPESISLTPDENGPWLVTDSLFQGGMETVSVQKQNEPGLPPAQLLHRPARPLAVGTKISVHWLGLLMILLLPLFFTACGKQEIKPVPAKASGSWQIPPHNITLPAPRSVGATNDGGVVVLDNAGRVIIYRPEGTVRHTFFMPEYSVGRPEGVKQLPDGTFIVCDTHYHRVIHFEESGREIRRWGSFGKGPGQFIYPVAVDRDEDGFLYIGEYGGNDRVQKFTTDGTYVSAFGSFGTDPGQFQRPSGIAISGDTVFVVDAINQRIQEFSRDGAFLGITGRYQAPVLSFPYDIEVDDRDRLWLVEYGSGAVTCLDKNGRILGRSGSSGSGPGQFKTPWGIAFSPRSRNLYIADTGNRRVAIFHLQP